MIEFRIVQSQNNETMNGANWKYVNQTPNMRYILLCVDKILPLKSNIDVTKFWLEPSSYLIKKNSSINRLID